ncbi:hypothetical protein KIW84_064248 [Lathyrus oleraceus]|uniref:CCHC-type domain-containing protein n=1 Tax=Pisum sativum TaxID=3888 RepID=A0A9D4WC69_PEA|nr:hypothetical protein KIW84_064248 [Pisum sativum]
MDKSLPELLAMLRTAEQNLKSKGKSILMIGNGKRQNKRPTKQGDKGKGKEVAKPKPTVVALKPSGGIAKEGTCFHCGKTGHWKRNCPKYLEDKKNGVETSTSAYTLNRVPSKKVEKTPYELWSETRGYYFYNPSEGKVFVARTGVFLEKDFISKGISGRKVELEEIQESQGIDTPMDE